MTHAERSPRAPFTATGTAALRACRRRSGTGAPSIGRLALALALALAAALALSASPAAAKQVRVFSGSFGSATSTPANPYPLSTGRYLGASSVAVDATSHDVYVTDQGNRRVEKFDSAGHFLLMFGEDVNKTKVEEAGSTQAERDLCAAASGDACQPGARGTSPGAFDPSNEGEFDLRALFVAVDNSSGPSKGDVYVSDSDARLITKFGPAGNLIESWGDNGPGGTANGQFNGPPTQAFAERFGGITVDPSGNLWVREGEGGNGDDPTRNVLEFAQDGSLVESWEVSAQFIGSGPNGIAVDAAGNVYTNGNKFDSALNLIGRVATASSFTQGSAVDPSTNDYYEAVESFGAIGGAILRFDSSCQPSSISSACTPVESFGANHLQPPPNGFALDSIAVDPSGAKTVYVTVSAQGEVRSFSIVTAPDVATEKASGFTATSATLNGAVNPAGVALTQCFFEYGTTTAYGHTAPCQPEPGSIPADSKAHLLSAEITGLEAGETYHFRLVAANPNDLNEPSQGEDLVFGPPLLHASSAAAVSSTAATLQAQVNPQNVDTHVRFEYGTEAGVYPNATPEVDLGSAAADQGAARHLAGLAPQTTYHYRAIATSVLGTVEGEDHAFTTQGPAGPLALPDSRAWEMVSPLDKKGGGIASLVQAPYSTLVQAAPDGEAITYGSPVSFGEGPSSPAGNQYLSRRGGGGWSTQNINIPTNSGNYFGLASPPYKAFSADLSTGLVTNGQYEGATPPPLPGTEAAPGAGNFYLRDSATGGFRALLTEANRQLIPHPVLPISYLDATPDFHHLVVRDANENLFEWSEGDFTLLNLLPGKTTTTPGADLVNGYYNLQDPRALSADGSRVVWSTFSPNNLYLRENATQPQSALTAGKCTEPEKACTVQIDATQGGSDAGGLGHFLAASADGSKIFFLDTQRLTPDSTASTHEHCQPSFVTGDFCGDLYRFEPEAPAGQRLTDLTVDHADPGGAEALGVLGGSDDGSYLYFVANGVLAENEGAHGAHATLGNCQQGQTESSAHCNLYLYHAGATTFIATLSGADDDFSGSAPSLQCAGGNACGDWGGAGERPVRLSPDGRHLLFVSQRSLTGYDSGGASEVYLYDATASAAAGSLACLSCNPTGARPLGLSDVPAGAASSGFEELAFHEPRALSANGRRAFFDSFDALVPQDSNGRLDVYEWEAPGTGTCTESSPAFAQPSGGCLSLISSGTGAENSEFLDASEDGRDVFFLTGASLLARDPGSADVYDAREGGGFPELAEPVECEADACQQPATPPNDATPGSLTFNGAGNEHPVKPRCAKGKVRSRGRCVAKHHKKKQGSHKRAGANRGGAK